MARLHAGTLGSLDPRIAVPSYDRTAVTAGVVHLGVGGFHRAHQAVYHDRLLAAGQTAWGICGMGVLPSDRAMADALAAQDGLYTLLVKHPDGTVEPRVIGSIVDYVLAPDDPEAAIERLAAPATRVVSLTITEGGYNVDDQSGAFDAGASGVVHDLEHPHAPRTVFGLVVEALARRRARGIAPFTVLSCDNLVGNGDVARTAFGSFAALRDTGLGEWVVGHVAFPNSVVDRITPATSDADRLALAERFGLEDRVPVVCEPFSQWVIVDAGAGDLPPYHEAGALRTADVRARELMKLRLLNAGHQAIAHTGRLAGLRFVDEAARDPQLSALLAAYLDREAVPTLSGIPAAEVAAFRDAIPERLGNPAIADTLERLAADASDRLPKFVLPVVGDRLAAGGGVRIAATVVAAWVRCLDGVDEQGAPIATVDRRLERLRALAARRATDPGAILGERDVFGGLGADERFAAPYRDALASLDARGVRATLAALL